MQRLLTLATLVVLGGLAFIFLRDGGLSNIAMNPGGDGGAQNAGGLAGAAGSSENLRIASFNIEAFGEQKASNEAVMQALSEIIRKFHVVAIQGIRTQDDYHIPNFVRRINQAGRHYNHLVGPRIGNSSATEQYAFVFDQDRVECDFNTSYTIRDPENLLHREPLVASFRVKGVPPDRAFTFTLINVHTDPHIVGDELNVLAEVYRVVRQAGRNEDDVIMLGDFNTDDSQLGRLGQIPGIKPLLRGETTDTRRTALFDNLMIHQPSTTEYVGRSGVYDFMRIFNLTQQNALSISDHLPVYAEFSVYELDYAGRVASRAGRMVR